MSAFVYIGKTCKKYTIFRLRMQYQTPQIALQYRKITATIVVTRSYSNVRCTQSITLISCARPKYVCGCHTAICDS